MKMTTPSSRPFAHLPPTAWVVWLTVIATAGLSIRPATGARHQFTLQWPTDGSNAGLETWGLRDVTAPVGKLFEYQLVPRRGGQEAGGDAVDTGSGELADLSDTFTVYQLDDYGERHHLADWMLLDRHSAVIRGVPDQRHVGRHYRIQVTSKQNGNEVPTTDDFWIQVTDDSSSEPVPSHRQSTSGRHHHRDLPHGGEQHLERGSSESASTIVPVSCPHSASLTTATVVLDTDIDELTAVDRVALLQAVADYFRLPASLLRMRRPQSDRPLLDLNSALAAGPGNLVTAPEHAGLLVQWDVGCGNVRAELFPSLELLETSAADGRLSNALPNRQLVVGWHIAKTSLFDGGAAGSPRRSPKHTSSSGRRPYVVPTATPALPIAVRPTSRVDAVTVTVDAPSPTVAVPSASTASVVIVPTLTISPPPGPTASPGAGQGQGQGQGTTPVHPVTRRPIGGSTDEIEIEEASSTTTTSSSTTISTMMKSTTAKHRPHISTTVRDVLHPSVSTIAEQASTKGRQGPTAALPASATTTRFAASGSTQKPTKRPQKTPRPETNQAPEIKNPIGRLEVVAGSVLWYVIPNDAFVDREDGGTDQLVILFQTHDGHDVTPVSWIKLNSTSRTLYGMPTDADIGQHHYMLAAVNSQNKIQQMAFQVDVVPGPPLDRLSHEFSVVLQLEYDEFVYKVERRMDVASRIAGAFGDTDPGRITVTRIGKGSVIYSWTNNTVPAGPPCPAEQIQALSDRLVDPATGQPRQAFVDAMRPYEVERIETEMMGSCLDQPPTDSPPSTKQPDVIIAEPGKSSAALDTMWLIVVVAAVVVGFLVVLLLALCVVCCCRARRRSVKQRRQREDELSCANKGIPVIFADELEDDTMNNADDRKSATGSGTIPRSGINRNQKTPDDTPASTLKRRVVIDDGDADLLDQNQSPPPPEYPRSDPASRTSTLRSDYKAPLISSDDSADEEQDKEAARRSQDDENNGSTGSGNVLQHLPQPPNTGSLPPYQKL